MENHTISSDIHYRRHLRDGGERFQASERLQACRIWKLPIVNYISPYGTTDEIKLQAGPLGHLTGEELPKHLGRGSLATFHYHN